MEKQFHLSAVTLKLSDKSLMRAEAQIGRGSDAVLVPLIEP
jgi:hypothetical protein